MRITSIQQPPRKRFFEVHVDYAMVVKLSPEVLAPANLRVGQVVSAERLKTLELSEARHSALAGALRLLSYRPRSEKELRDSLRLQKTPPEVLAETLTRLRELRLLNDAEFARTYVETRDRTSPRGRRLLAMELAAKGVDRKIVGEPLADVDEIDAAYRVATKRARSMGKGAYADFQRRLGDYLLRRGFGYETVRATVRRLWEELRPGTQIADEALESP